MGRSQRLRAIGGALAVLVVLAGCNDTGLTAASSIPTPPWPRPDDTAGRVQAAGLRLLATEGTAFHIHSLLKVFHNGQPVIVPAAIGIVTGGISPLHTHDTSGLVHIESPEKQDFTLGQFFAEWGIPMTGAKAWAAGQPVADPAGLVFKDLTAVTVAFGAAPNPVPSLYALPSQAPPTP